MGEGVEKDEDQAANWTLRAAEQSLPDAMYKISNLYLHGVGLEQDEQEAINWCRKAADVGQVEAEFHQGVLYFLNNYFDEAANWLGKAMLHDHSRAKLIFQEIDHSHIGLSENKSARLFVHMCALSLGILIDPERTVIAEVASELDEYEMQRAQVMISEAFD